MRTHIKYPFCYYIISVLILFSIGCATPTKPNPVYQGILPDKFDTLAKINPLLAKEIRKLPELQDGMSPQEAYALENIIELYNNAPIIFNNAFEKMYQVGLPQVRQYCSPLQALFWLGEDGKLNNGHGLLVDYSLDRLLTYAWKFEERFLNLSEKEAKKVIEGIKDEWEKKGYSKVTRIEDINSMLLCDYNINSNMFSKETSKVIENSIKDNVRWREYETVVERLNSPELVTFYQRSNFSYWTDRGTRVGYSKGIFESKKGDCRDYTAFSVYCLQKAGYEAMAIKVVSPTGRRYHIVCEYKAKGKEYIMDNACWVCGGRKGISEKQIYIKNLPQIGVGYQ